MPIEHIYYTDMVRVCKNGDIERIPSKTPEWIKCNPNMKNIIINKRRYSTALIRKFCLEYKNTLIASKLNMMRWKYLEDNKI